MSSYLEGWKNIVDFSGRATRKEFWLFMGITYLIFFGALIAAGIIYSPFNGQNIGIFMGFMAGVFLMVSFLPMLSVSIRRLHDIGLNGWFYLLGFIPFVGPVVMLTFSLVDSKPGTNKYGPNPKGIESVESFSRMAASSY